MGGGRKEGYVMLFRLKRRRRRVGARLAMLVGLETLRAKTIFNMLAS